MKGVSGMETELALVLSIGELKQREDAAITET